jgi:hypothetical protein
MHAILDRRIVARWQATGSSRRRRRRRRKATTDAGAEAEAEAEAEEAAATEEAAEAEATGGDADADAGDDDEEAEEAEDDDDDEVVACEEFDRAMKVAYWCMQVQPASRPSMGRVIQMLEGSLDLGVPPPIPMLFGDLLVAANDTMASTGPELETAATPTSLPPSSSSSVFVASQSSFGIDSAR